MREERQGASQRSFGELSAHAKSSSMDCACANLRVYSARNLCLRRWLKEGMIAMFKMWQAVIWERNEICFVGFVEHSALVFHHMIERGISMMCLPSRRLGLRARERAFYSVTLQTGLGQACWILINISWWGRESIRGPMKWEAGEMDRLKTRSCWAGSALRGCVWDLCWVQAPFGQEALSTEV